MGKILSVTTAFLLVTLILGGSSQATPFGWLEAPSAQAELDWSVHSPDYQEQLAGKLVVAHPDYFSFTADSQALQLKVTQYQGIVAISQGRRTHYEYYPFDLFSLYQEMFLPLVNLEVEEYLGDENLDGVDTHRYRNEEPLSVYWLDTKTKLPLRGVLASGEVLFELVEHIRGVSGDLIWVRLAVNDQQGHVELVSEDGKWFPVSLSLTQEDLDVSMELSKWELRTDNPHDSTLEALVDLLQKGEEAYTNERWLEAIEYYHRVVQIDPHYYPGYFYIAYGSGVEGDYLRSVDAYSQWLMLQPDQALALNNLAFTYMLQEVNLHQALAMAERAVSLDPRPAYFDTLGYGYYLVREYEQALEYLHMAVEEMEEEEAKDVYGHLSLVYRALGDKLKSEYYQDKKEELAASE